MKVYAFHPPFFSFLCSYSSDDSAGDRRTAFGASRTSNHHATLLQYVFAILIGKIIAISISNLFILFVCLLLFCYSKRWVGNTSLAGDCARCTGSNRIGRYFLFCVEQIGAEEVSRTNEYLSTCSVGRDWELIMKWDIFMIPSNSSFAAIFISFEWLIFF